MTGTDEKHLRLSSCIRTLIDIHASFTSAGNHEALMARLENLETALAHLTFDSVPDSEILRVEDATNRLMDEMRVLFNDSQRGPIYRGPLN